MTDFLPSIGAGVCNSITSFVNEALRASNAAMSSSLAAFLILGFSPSKEATINFFTFSSDNIF